MAGTRPPYNRNARTHSTRPERWPLETKSVRITAQPIRLSRDMKRGTSVPKGPKHPW